MSSSNSSLARYRAAVLIVTAIAAGCTIYYIRTSVRSSDLSRPPPSQPSLHRSNAQRRSRLSRETDHSESNVTAEREPPGHAVATDVGVGNPSLPLIQDAPDGLRRALLRRGLSDEADQDASLSNTSLPQVHDEPNALSQTLEERGNAVDGESEHSWRDSTESEDASKEGQSLLNLLYRIAEEQARKDGYVHRGISCNSCNTMPIRGIRYRCSNCADVDLCEACESMQLHPKTHIFYKVRIPAPLLSSPKQPQPVWYPGKPAAVIHPLDPVTVAKYCSQTGFQDPEIEALWEQFRCLAATEYLDDPYCFYMAIDRPTFDKCFIPTTATRPPLPNLIYDRLFAFYDWNRDGLIDFDEFIKGLAILSKPKSDDRRRKVFEGYDIDDDGYVDRKDFLRMFRAFYALSKEMAKEVLIGMDEDFYDGGGAREIITSSQPISSVFSGSIPLAEQSRTSEGKRQDESGDYVMKDDGGIFRESEDDTGDHNEAVADAAEDTYPCSSIEDAKACRQYEESMLEEETHGQVWPPAYANALDVQDALRVQVALEDINDPDDREKVRRVAVERVRRIDTRRRFIRDRAVQQRWHRQQFYLDEEDGALPPSGFKHCDTPETQPASRRSRSSSKVRFQDDLATDDDEHETRSATSVSSRSIPVGERWGGYEVPGPEKDVGREILYQVAQESLNELLDPVFRQREDLAIIARRTKREREHFRAQISAFVTDELRERIKVELDDYEWRWRHSERTFSTGHDFFFGYISERIKLDGAAAPASRAGIDWIDVPQVPVSALHGPEENRHPSSTRPVIAEEAAHPSATEAPRIVPAGPFEQAMMFPSFIDQRFYSSFDPTLEQWEIPYLALNTSPSATTFDPADLTEGAPDRNSHNDVASPINQTTEPSPDPTLPQNRPNSVSPTVTSSRPIPSDPEGAPGAPGAPSTEMPSTSSRSKRPSRQRLLFLAVIDMIEDQDNKRGGPGRVSYEEFDEILLGPKAAALGFVGQWVEMASI